MDDKATPITTFMRNQKVEVVEKYNGEAGQWSKVQLSRGSFAYIKTDDLVDRPHDLSPADERNWRDGKLTEISSGEDKTVSESPCTRVFGVPVGGVRTDVTPYFEYRIESDGEF